MATEPRASKNAFMAACTIGRTRPDLVPSHTGWGTDEAMEAARIIDAEAIEPELARHCTAVAELASDVARLQFMLEATAAQLRTFRIEPVVAEERARTAADDTLAKHAPLIAECQAEQEREGAIPPPPDPNTLEELDDRARKQRANDDGR